MERAQKASTVRVTPSSRELKINATATLTVDTTCGVVSHPPECLCDVVAPVTECASFPWRDSYLYHEIVSYLDLCAPFTDAEILKILTMQVETHDAVDAASLMLIPISNKPQKLTPTMNEFISERVIAGDPSPVIRAEVERLYGVTISPSHMSHLRNRLVRKFPAL